MKIIGVTGGIGSGKTTVSGMFASFGAEVVDADEIARAVTKSSGAAYKEIVDAFGEDILLPDMEINRKALGKIVFQDKKSLELLNKITHKYVFEEIKKRIETSLAHVIVLDVPLLFSSDFPFECDLTVGVIADREERIIRVEKRDGLSREEILKRIENQISDEVLRQKADVIIENNSYDAAKFEAKNILKRIGIE